MKCEVESHSFVAGRQQTRPSRPRRPRRVQGLCSGLCIWLLLAACPAVSAQTIEILQMTGEPWSTGVIDDLGRPSNASPNIVVYPGSFDRGVFDEPDVIWQSRGGIITAIATQTQEFGTGYQLGALWGANQTLPATNSEGDVLFVARFNPIGSSISDEGLFLYDASSGSLETVVKDGDPVPDGNGYLYVALTNHPALGNDGRVAFWGTISGAVGGLGNGSGIFRWTNGNLVRIARSGQTRPGGTELLEAFTWPSINHKGDVAFWADLDPSGQGIYRGRGGQLVEIARTGDESPAGWVIDDFIPLSGVAINDSAQVAFRARVDTPVCCALTDVLYLGSGGNLTRLTYGGAAASDGGIVPYTISRNLALNNQGQVAFTGQYSNSNSGIFRVSPGGVAVKIAREDETVPGSTAQKFTLIWGHELALNERGDVAFVASFNNGSGAVEGLFFYSDSRGLVRVVEPGTPLAGNTVKYFQFVGTSSFDWRSGEPSGLDDNGNVVFWFRLNDNREGIAVFNSAGIFSDGFESGNVSRWSLSSP